MTDNKELTEQYEEDLRIIEAATDGPWSFGPSSDLGHSQVYIGYPWGYSVCQFVSVKNAKYIAHFNPSYTKQLVEKAKEATALAEERDALVKRVEELEKGLKKIAAIEDNLTGGDWDEIEEARSIADGLLK